MNAPSRQSAEHGSPTATEIAYKKAAKKHLEHLKTRIGGVQAKIQCAIASGRIDLDEQLASTLRAVDISFETAEAQLERIVRSSDGTWMAKADGVESASEDLSYSIKQVVAQFSDRST